MKVSKRQSVEYLFKSLALPGLKRYILILACAITTIVFGVLWLLDKHPIMRIGKFLRELLYDTSNFLPNNVNGIIAITVGAIMLVYGIVKTLQVVLGGYFPEGRDSIPEVLYKKRYLDRAPRVVVVGGGTGLSNLLRGLKRYTNNITAIVTVGDDGGSSGRLRTELGVLPPGDIRNCITALADEDKLVTELFRYRFEQGEGLEGHSFGNLFITALCAVTKGDMLEAVRTASRVLNSRGQVLPATLDGLTLKAEFTDGTSVVGESNITSAGKRIKRLSLEPAIPIAVSEAITSIMQAELIVLGPGSLFTSIIPNLLIPEITEAIRHSSAAKIYVCNVMTQPGETTDFSVGDHVKAILAHTGGLTTEAGKLVNAVLVNDLSPPAAVLEKLLSANVRMVKYDQDKLREFGIDVIRRPLVSETSVSHHDSLKLARILMLWFFRYSRRRAKTVKPVSFSFSEKKIVVKKEPAEVISSRQS